MEHKTKGVVCKIIPDSDAPMDIDGNIADVVMDPNSTISRMNLGRFYEQYINGASRDVYKRLCINLNIKEHTHQSAALDWLMTLDSSVVNSNYEYLLSYYRTVSPRMYELLVSPQMTQSPIEYLSEVIHKGVYLYIPTDNPVDTQDVILELEKNFPQTYGPVTYVGNSGNRVTTLENVRIGSVYMILLEKIADTWSAVSSSKLQHFGVISQLTRNDKYSKPARNKAVRGAGEAEVRILISYVGPEHVVEIMDRNNNPTTHKHIVTNLLEAKKPSNVNNLVNRKVLPYGGNKPIQLVNHILQVSGVKYAYTPHKPTRRARS